MEEVVLVDEKDNELGFMEKNQAHREGLLHRAFSIFIFNSNNQLLLHKRALSKYHSPGLWTNTCCSHPRKAESLEDATNRRLAEEMGMNCNLKHDHHFIYNVKLDKGMIEHEFDHVFIGFSDELPQPNPEEVCDYKYISIKECLDHMKNSPNDYTEWFKIAFPKVLKTIDISLYN